MSLAGAAACSTGTGRPATPVATTCTTKRIDGAAGQAVPADQDKAKVDGPTALHRTAGMVQAVIGRTDKDPAERSEAPAQIGVRERHQAGIGNQACRRDGTARF